MAINTFQRYEKKYILSKEDRIEIEKVIKEQMNDDIYCQGDKAYLVRSIYYDTKDSDLIRNSILNPEYKEKIRVRKYGEYRDGKEQYFLELKRKYNGVVYKRRILLDRVELDHFFNEGIKPIRTSAIDQQIILEIEYFLKTNKVMPTTFIAYNRRAYVGKNNSAFRISFDENIFSRRDNYDFESDELLNSIIDNNLVVMEVKIHDAIPLWLVELFSRLKIYSTSISKYAIEYEQSIKKGEEVYV